MISAKHVNGLYYAVLGLGRTGLSAAKALKAGGAQVIAWDDVEEARENAINAGIVVKDLSVFSDWQTISFLIVSPGIPHLYPNPHPIVYAAMQEGVPLDNDIGLFFRSFAFSSWTDFDIAPRIVAITGSNGKSTTSALIHHILKETGKPTQLAGNIGCAALDIDPPKNGEIVVLELSSYQIEVACALTPDIAVFTNLSLDHLERHGGEGGYFAAKRRLFTEGSPQHSIIGVDETAGKFLANQLVEVFNNDRVIRTSLGQKHIGLGWEILVHKGLLMETIRGRQVASIDLRRKFKLLGSHNQQNVASAFAACRALGLSPKVIEATLESFTGLVHRSQFVGEINGIRFINDSKATNVASAARALQAFERVRWICCGLEKQGGVVGLRGFTGTVSKAYVIGNKATNFGMQLDCDFTISTTMEEAVRSAFKDAKEGETILLAPAAASFDQYDDYEKRGEDFIAVFQQVSKETI